MHEHSTIPSPHPQLLTEDPEPRSMLRSPTALAQAIEAEVAMFSRGMLTRDAQAATR